MKWAKMIIAVLLLPVCYGAAASLWLTPWSIRERYEKRIADLETKKVEIEAERVKKDAALRDLERGEQDFAKWQKNLAGLKKAIAEDVDTRIRFWQMNFRRN